MFFFVFLCFRCFPRACGQVFPPISPIKWGEIISIYNFYLAYMILVIWENRGNREKSQCFRGFAAFLLLGENWHKGQKGDFPRLSLRCPIRLPIRLRSFHRKAESFHYYFFVKRCGVPSLRRACCRQFIFVKRSGKRWTCGGGGTILV